MWEIVQKTKKDFIKIFSNNPTVVFYVTNLLFIFVSLLFIFVSLLFFFANLGSNIEEFKANFLMNPYGAYKFLYNSSMNKRGTGILVKNDIAFLEIQREADPEENFLLLRADIKGKNFTIGSIYGPNLQDRAFFTKLKSAVQVLGCDNVILGGDWNCSYSSDPIADNIDCLNMTNIPNARHSLYVQDLFQSGSILWLFPQPGRL